MALLTVINDRGYTEQYQLRGRECVLGRQSDTDLRLDARDVKTDFDETGSGKEDHLPWPRSRQNVPWGS